MRTTYLITWLLLSITLMSCIRDEAPNAEADILTCVVPADILKRDPVIENNKVTLMVKADIDLAHQSPEFTLTPGATISPASGTERDFTSPQYYTVTSKTEIGRKNTRCLILSPESVRNIISKMWIR